jgi:hypothetical protein
METTLDELHCPVLPVDIFVKAEGYVLIHGRLIFVEVGSMAVGVGKSFQYDYMPIHHHVSAPA